MRAVMGNKESTLPGLTVHFNHYQEGHSYSRSMTWLPLIGFLTGKCKVSIS